MNYKIHNWQDISNDFSESILLGNGASIGIDSSFNYSSLKDHACSNGLLNQSVNSLFDYFETSNFELILRLVWQATKVNEALALTDNATTTAYDHIRTCLIKAVQEIHPPHNSIEDQIPAITNFLSPFKTILSLNYDLTLYWVMMYANEQVRKLSRGTEFKDCMIKGRFRSDWQTLRGPLRGTKAALVFYPHGSLVLARHIAQQEVKLALTEVKLNASTPNDLLDYIKKSWLSGDYVPLFVSEGTSAQKVKAIENSHYLSIVYREVIPLIGKNLTIFGWGFGESDIHILKKLKESSVERIAVSVYQNDQSYCIRAAQMIRSHIGKDIKITFFDSESNGCWNKPIGSSIHKPSTT